MPAPLLFHFDFVSPYAFLSWTQIRGIAARAGRTVEPVPVLFAGLLDAHGTKGPAEIAAKRRYLFKDVARKAHRLGVAAVLSDAGLDGAALTAAAQAPEAKARLRAATDAAIARGVFGVPTVLDGDELFWGTDALPDLEAYLRGELPAFSDAAWSTLPAAAVRKGAS